MANWFVALVTQHEFPFRRLLTMNGHIRKRSFFLCYHSNNVKKETGIRLCFRFYTILMELKFTHLLKFKWMNFNSIRNTIPKEMSMEKKQKRKHHWNVKRRWIWHMLHENDTIVRCLHLIFGHFIINAAVSFEILFD